MSQIFLPHHGARLTIPAEPGKLSWLVAVLLMFAGCLLAWTGLGLLVAKLIS